MFSKDFVPFTFIGPHIAFSSDPVYETSNVSNPAEPESHGFTVRSGACPNPSGTRLGCRVTIADYVSSIQWARKCSIIAHVGHSRLQRRRMVIRFSLILFLVFSCLLFGCWAKWGKRKSFLVFKENKNSMKSFNLFIFSFSCTYDYQWRCNSPNFSLYFP